MATRTILQLLQALGLTGAEYLEAVQNGVSVRVTSAQIAELAISVVPIGPVGIVTDAPTGGTHNNYAPAGFGASAGYLDLTPASGDCSITGIQAGFDGQLIIVTNLSGLFKITLNALSGGSMAANQLRMVGNLVLDQNNSQAFKYSAALGKWVGL